MNTNYIGYILAGVSAVLAVSYLAKQGVKSVGNAVNPTNPENVFYQGTNAVGEVLTGQQDFSLGSYIYDVLHPNGGAQ